MRLYINHLSASSRPQGSTQNSGVGAKIVAGSRNAQGLEYRSWNKGQGALVCFKREPVGPRTTITTGRQQRFLAPAR